MSQLVKKHWSYFQLLMTTTSKIQRKQLLDTITNDQLRALVQIVVNLLRSVLPLSPGNKTKVKKHRTFIRKLGNTAISLKQKKLLLCRQGTVIVLLLKSVEPALKSFIQ